jgi:hypothetical protein
MSDLIVKKIKALDYMYLDGSTNDSMNIYSYIHENVEKPETYDALKYNPYSQGWCIIVITDTNCILPIPLNYKIHLQVIKTLFLESYEGIKITREFIHKSFQECEELDAALSSDYLITSKREHYDHLLAHLVKKEDYTLCSYLINQYQDELAD